jgi:hypothetical protein
MKKPTRLAEAARAAIEGSSLAAVTVPTERRGKSRIMYIESKAEGLSGGSARIGRVTFSKTEKTIYYRSQIFHRLPRGGFKSNYYDRGTNEDYWISGPKKDGSDRLYGERVPIEIDEDVREEYWTQIRSEPAKKNNKTA